MRDTPLPIRAVVPLTVGALLVVYLAGGFDGYWERHRRVWDAALQRDRCMYNDEDRFMDEGLPYEIRPPCVALTAAGEAARNSRIEECEKAGGGQETCRLEASRWLHGKLDRPVWAWVTDVPERLYYRFYATLLSSRS